MPPPLPGAASERIASLVSSRRLVFSDRVVGSCCALSFSRIARRSLALRPAHSHCHQFGTRQSQASATSLPSLPPCLLRLFPAGAVAGWDLHPLENAAFAWRTPAADIGAPSTAGGHKSSC